MSDPTSIFGNSNTPETPGLNGNVAVPNAQEVQALTDLLGSIKNERGEPKYKNVQEALNALKHSQEYIPTLKNELTQKETELQAARAEASRIAALEATVQALTQKTDPAANQPQGMTEEQIANLVNSTLTKKQQETAQAANLEKVVTAMKARFGDQAEATFYGKAKELGLSVEEFNALAAKTPVAVLNLLGVSVSAPQGQHRQGSVVNTEGFQPNKETLISRNKTQMSVGATTQELKLEQENAKKMVEELHAQGKEIADLTNPKEFFKYFS